MIRLLTTLAFVLVMLVGFDDWLSKRQTAEQIRASRLQLLFDPSSEIVPERIRRIEVHSGAGRRIWVYEKIGKHWRYPSYHGAYIQQDRVDFLLNSLLASYGTVVSDDRTEDHKYGLTAQQAVQVILADDSGTLGKVSVGRGPSGPRAGEAFIRHNRKNALTFHLHANPRHALVGGNPPMLDPYLLPKALPRKSIVKVNFITTRPAPQQLRRVDKPFPRDGSPLLHPGEYTYDWIISYPESQIDTCLSNNVFTFMGFLKNLRFKSLYNPSDSSYGFSDNDRIELVDEDGTMDILHFGRSEEGTVYIRNAAAGLVCSVDLNDAELLFPKPGALTDSLTDSSPYQVTKQ